jgi:hypothetical protein
MLFHKRPEFGRIVPTCYLLKHIAILAGNADPVSVAEPSCGFNQRVEHRLQIECRAADYLEHVGGGGLLLQRFAQFVEQARVLDRDDSLGGEVLHQLDLLAAAKEPPLSVMSLSARESFRKPRSSATMASA